jgi:hypothetical protein
MRDYQEADADNNRWQGFEFRPGDIVVDAPSKSGTTWTQLLVALLVFDGPEFPAPVGEMSLWMELKTRPVEEVFDALAAQTHRRFIKSHTPLDGIPMRDDIVYVCAGRDPRDAAVSMVHHSDNIDRERWAQLMGEESPAEFDPPPFEERLDGWIDSDAFPGFNVRFLAHHYTTFWERRDQPNVGLFHFADYVRDLPGELLRLAALLEIPLGRERAEELAVEASIDRARERANDIVPEAHAGIFKSVEGFLRSGSVGEGAASMTPGQQERYDAIVADTMESDLAAWVHHGSGGA